MVFFQTMQGWKWNKDFNILKLIVKRIYILNDQLTTYSLYSEENIF